MFGIILRAVVPAVLAVMMAAGDAPALLFGEMRNESERSQHVWLKSSAFSIREPRASVGAEFGWLGGGEVITGVFVPQHAGSMVFDADTNNGSKRTEFDLDFTSNDRLCHVCVLDDHLVNPDAFVAAGYYQGEPGRESGDFSFEMSAAVLTQIPEPPTMMLLGAGLVAVAGMVRRKVLRTGN